MSNKHVLIGLVICLLISGCTQTGHVATNGPDISSNPLSENPPTMLPIDYPVSSIQFSHLTGEDGLSQSVIDCMLQDRFGYIWIGTEDGLNKYDGLNFTIYKNDPDDPDSLSHSSVTALAEAPDGTLWIGTRGGGLNLYSRETGKFTSFRSESDDPQTISSDYIESIAITANGVAWIGTNGGGLDLYNPVTKAFTRFQKNNSSNSGISNNQILSLAIGSDGIIWVGTAYGLDSFDPTLTMFSNFRFDDTIPFVISRSAINSLLVDEPNLWIGTDSGLFQLNTTTKQIKEIFASGLTSFTERIPVLSILKSRNGTLWVGTQDFGLIRVAPDLTRIDQMVADPRDPTTLSDNRILSILEDRSGIIWLGTNSGFVNQIDPLRNQFKNLVFSPWKTNSISDPKVWAMATSHNGDLWIGTDGGGLNKLNLITGSMQYFRHNPQDENTLDDDHIRSLYLDNRGNLWVGTIKGLNRLHYLDGTWTHFPLQKITETDSLDSNRTVPMKAIPVLVIREDENGFLWIGTENSGLYKFNPETGETQNLKYVEGIQNSLTSNTVWSMLVEPPSILWVGTDRGLSRFDTENNVLVTYLPSSRKRGSLSDYRILSIYRDSRDILWIGTGAGLNRFDEKTGLFAAYREKDGLPNDFINSIQEDEAGRLWISTNRGISRFDTTTGNFTNFDQADGLTGNEFIQGSGTRAENGYIYFGGINGVSYIRPDEIPTKSYVPDIMLTSLTQGGQPLEDGVPVEMIKSVTLTWPKNYFEFTFQNQSSSRSGKQGYAYRLVPFENEWITTQKIGSGRYTNLPGGNYTLNIRSSNNQGGWNPERTALEITVIPPVWENQWFTFILGMLIFGLIPVSILLRTRSIQKRNKELTELVTIRTKEIDQRRQVAEGLRDILIHINSNKSIADSLEFIACQIRNLAKADSVVITKTSNGLTSSEDFLIKSSSSTQIDEISNQDIREIYSLLIRESNFIPINLEAYFSRVSEENVPAPFKGGLAFPVILEEKVEAVLLVLMKTQKNWSEEEMDIFTSFSDQIALALGNSRLRQKEADLAMLNERNRLARDLHDAVTQTLFSASLLAEAFPSVWENNPQEGKKLIQEMRQLTRGALAEMRSLLMELRPSAMSEARLPDLLRQLAEAVIGRTGLEIKLEVDPDLHLNSEVNTTLYRIAQEALTNIVKHAHASKVWIRCKSIRMLPVDNQIPAQTDITMEVEDNGCGFEEKTISPDHFGLYNIHERADSIGAQVTIESKIDCGTIVSIHWVGEEIQGDD